MGFLTNYVQNYAALRLGRQPRRPLIVSYYLTHRCPLACVYCSDGDGRPFHQDLAEELPTADVKRLFGLFRKTTSVLDVTGGEPMVRPDLEELLAHAKELGFTTVLNTKGLGIGERPELVEHTDLLVLSLETFDEEKCARVIGRPLETARRLLRGLDDALRLTRKLKKKLVVSTVVMPDNVGDVGTILRWCLAEKVVFQVAPQMVGTRPPQALYGNAAYREALQAVIEAKRRTGLVVGALGYLENVRDLRSAPCHPLLLADVRPDSGLYYPCIELKYAKQKVLQHGSLEAAQEASRREFGPVPADCGDRCQIFCHMALSMSQASLKAGLLELRTV